MTSDRHPAELAPEDLLRDCDVVRTRRGGPGGQHRNKVETAVVITHRPTGCTAQASERRSQKDNLAVAVERLRLTLAMTVRVSREHPAETGFSPSPLWNQRIRAGRMDVATTHPDFAPLIAECLDYLAITGWDVAAVSSALGVSSSQIVRFLAKDPMVLAFVNERRRSLEKRPYRVR